MYNLEIRENVDRIFNKLAKKDKVSFEYLSKKEVSLLAVGDHDLYK